MQLTHLQSLYLEFLDEPENKERALIALKGGHFYAVGINTLFGGWNLGSFSINNNSAPALLLDLEAAKADFAYCEEITKEIDPEDEYEGQLLGVVWDVGDLLKLHFIDEETGALLDYITDVPALHAMGL